jgi:putative membrane protein
MRRAGGSGRALYAAQLQKLREGGISTQFETLSGIRAIGSDNIQGFAIVVVVGAAILLRWLGASHPSHLPFWAPWEFSWAQFLGLWLTAWWYVRGLSLTPAADRPSIVRQVSFLAGILVVYLVVQTHFEYLAEHMFFLTQLQHVGMHHLGPFLMALAWPGATLKLGMPMPLRRMVKHPVVASCIDVLQQPVLAAILFAGLIALWLIPSVHFRAMIDPKLYAVMNWSMVVDGVLFWCLVLDPRAKPPARLSFGARGVLSMLVMFPQILLGALVVFNSHDLYSYYDLCGRIYPTVDPHSDQIIGGLIIWIPPAMMCVLGFLLVMVAIRRVEEERTQDNGDASSDNPNVIVDRTNSAQDLEPCSRGLPVSRRNVAAPADKSADEAPGHISPKIRCHRL